MREITKVKPSVPIIHRKKRVAAYAGVSLESERLMHSLSAQISYYSELIQNNPECEYAGVYPDEGIIGISEINRINSRVFGFAVLNFFHQRGKILFKSQKSICKRA